MEALMRSPPYQTLQEWNNIDLREFDLLTEHCTRLGDSGIKMIIIPKSDQRFMVKGAINDYPVQFLVDTGAAGVSIPINIADKIGLQKGQRVTLGTAGGTTTGWDTAIRMVELDDTIHLSGRNIASAAHINSNRGRYILLGMSVLSKLSVFTFNDRMILRQITGPRDEANLNTQEMYRRAIMIHHMVHHECSNRDEDDMVKFQCSVDILKRLDRTENVFQENDSLRADYPLATFLYP